MPANSSPRCRRRRWTPPAIDTEFVRSFDGSRWTCKQVYRKDQQVLLVNEAGIREYVFANVLESDYEQVSA